MPNWKLRGSTVVEDSADPPVKADSLDEVAVEDEFDPADHTIDEVKAYVNDNPDELQRVYDLEHDGKARSTLLDWLTGD